MALSVVCVNRVAKYFPTKLPPFYLYSWTTNEEWISLPVVRPFLPAFSIHFMLLPPPPAVATCLPNLSLVLMILVLFPPAFFSLIHWCKCMDMYTWFYSSLLILSHLYSHSFILLLFISQNLLQLFPNFFQVTFKYSLKIKTWHISLKGLSNLPLLSENLPLPAN